MTSRERVNACLDLRGPGRMPRDLWGERIIPLTRPEDWRQVLDLFPMDFARTPSILGPSSRAKGLAWEPGGRTDEWGSVWTSLEVGLSGEVKTPALPDWKHLESYEPPYDLIKNNRADEVSKYCRSAGNKFILGETGPGPFERSQALRGTVDFFCDLAEQHPRVPDLIRMVHEYNVRHLQAWCGTEIDAVTMGDDWGSQRSLLISPQMWQKIFKPLYADYVEIIHGFGKRFFFHSDGYIPEIIPDLIEIGIDAINCQIFCMDIEELAESYKGKITFWGEIDPQHILPFGTPKDVRRAVRRFVNALGDEKGGVIAQLAWGPIDPTENIIAAYEEFHKD